MQNGQLYVNDALVDLPQGYLVALSFAVNTLADLKTVQGNISNTISLPSTANNRAIFGYPDDMNYNGQAIIRKKLKARYIQNGVEVVPDGFLRVLGATKKTINVVITSGTVDFFDLLDGKLQDLDLSEYDHIWNIENVIASRANNAGYIYPIINYGNLSNDTTTLQGQSIYPAEMRPAIFAKTIVNKIVNLVGYTLVNKIVDDPITNAIYDKLLLPFSADKFIHSSRYAEYYSRLNIKVQATETLSWIGKDNKERVPIPFNYKVPIKTLVDPGNLWDGYHWTAPQIMTVDIEAIFPHIQVIRHFFVDDNINGAYFKIYKTPKGGTDLYNDAYKIYEPADSLGIDNSTNIGEHFNFKMTVTGVQVQAGDKITIVFETAGHNGSTDVYIFPTAELNIKINSDTVQFNEVVQMEAVLPDMSPIDFLKFISFMFCSIIQADNVTKTVTMVPFGYIIQNINNSVDWSDKVIEADEDYDVTIGDYGQENEAKFKTDDAIIPDTYGNASFYITDDNIDVYKDIYDIPFAPSFENLVLGNHRTSLISKITGNVSTVDNAFQFETSTENRIVLLDKQSVSQTQPVLYRNGSTTYPVTDNVPFTFFASGGSTADLTMQSIFDNHYPDLIRVLQDQRKLTCYLKLNEIDIQQLDFFKPVYIAKYQSFFYISKITDFTGVKPVKVELIRLY